MKPREGEAAPGFVQSTETREIAGAAAAVQGRRSAKSTSSGAVARRGPARRAGGAGGNLGAGLPRLHTAFGSVRETRAALRIATAWGLVDEKARLEVDAQLDEVAAMTWRTIHPRP